MAVSGPAPGALTGVLEFILEIDALKRVTRKTRPLGLDRAENPAEHSWQIALLALALEPFAAAPVQIDRVVRMLLVHDLGEIDTGDTLVYVSEGLAERKAAEAAAVKRLLGRLPSPRGAELLALWHEFDAEVTADARLAHAVDRAMPVLLNLANNGQSWRENGIAYTQVVAKVGGPIAAGCPALWDHLSTALAAAQRAGWFGSGSPAQARS
jgi:putative hydrolases of HD superfamily